MDGIESVVDSPIESPVETGIESQEPSGVVEATEDSATPQEQPESATTDESESSDGRRLPAHIKSALKALADLNPENKKVVQELRKAFFEHGAYRGTFPNASAAQAAKAQLELVGGAEGIAKIQSENAVWQEVDSRFEAGDSVVVDDIAKEYPDGFKKIMPHALQQYSSLDPAGFQTAIQPHLVALLDHAGLGPVLENITQALGANNVEAAKDLLGKTAAWLAAQKQQAGSRASNQPDPERQKFEQERKDFQSKQEQAFRQDIGRQTVTHQNAEMEKELKPYLKSRANLSPEAKTDLADGINREINRLLQADRSYQEQMKAWLASKSRDSAKITQYVNAKLSQVVPDAVKAVWTRRYGAAQPVKPAVAAKPNAATAPTQQNGAIEIAAKPDRAQIDWQRPGAQTLFITNRAYMAAGPMKGKLVHWK
jgi:hypothetical protein